MTEEPYRWLEAISNRREYVAEQLKGGSPVFAASLAGGILLLGVGTGQSKVFELYDRQALAGLGHPADIEKVRQSVIDAAHMEAFTRAPEDVSLRRMVSFGLSPKLKDAFEQIFSPPVLAEVLLAELGDEPGQDRLVRLNHDGSFHSQRGGVMLATPPTLSEAAALDWLQKELDLEAPIEKVVDVLLQCGWCLIGEKPFDASLPDEETRRNGWRDWIGNREVELGWLDRTAAKRVRFRILEPSEVGL